MVMADGRSRKAAATKKAAAARQSAARDAAGKQPTPRKEFDPKSVKMGIAEPGLGRVLNFRNASILNKRYARAHVAGAPGTTPKPYDSRSLGPAPSAPTGANRANAPKLKQGVQQPVNVRDRRDVNLGASRNRPTRDMKDKEGNIIGTRVESQFPAYGRARRSGDLPLPKVVVKPKGTGRAAKAAATKKKK
jgi:hypothetical protein